MEFYSGESGQPGRFSDGVCLRLVQTRYWLDKCAEYSLPNREMNGFDLNKEIQMVEDKVE